MCGGAFMILKFENIYVDQLLIHALHKVECILQKDLSRHSFTLSLECFDANSRRSLGRT